MMDKLRDLVCDPYFSGLCLGYLFRHLLSWEKPSPKLCQCASCRRHRQSSFKYF